MKIQSAETNLSARFSDTVSQMVSEGVSLAHRVKQATQPHLIKIAAAVGSIGIFASAYYFLTSNSTPDLPPRFSSTPNFSQENQCPFTEQPASPLFYNGTNLSKGNQCPLAERPATEVFSDLANATLGESQEVSMHPLMKGSEISALLKTTQKKLSDLYTLILNVVNMATQHWPAPLTTSIPLRTASYLSHGTKTQSLRNRPPFNNAQFQQAINAYNLQARTSLAG